MQKKLEEYFDRLWPICRSITGQGFLDSLDILKELIPLEKHGTKSGSMALDWTVPKVWNVNDAYVICPEGKKIIDFKANNLHLLNYSSPVKATIDLIELQKHLYSLPELPDAIPYVTSYYKERWGFCLTEKQRQSLKPGKYEVFIDSTLEDGELYYGMSLLKSTVETNREILISTYLCHPSMANNELSGPLVTAFLYKELEKLPTRNFNFRFVFVPETIGSLCFLKDYGDHLKKNCLGGFVITCCGDEGPFTYKKSREESTFTNFHSIDFLNQYCTEKSKELSVRNFFPTGSDERQYCSPGFNLAIGSITRSMYGEYEEYHTSLDNKDFISFEAMKESVGVYKEIISKMNQDTFYRNLKPHGEIMLGRRGLYPTLGAGRNVSQEIKAMNYLLNYSDGLHTIQMISDYSKIPVEELKPVARRLVEHNLLSEI